MVDFGGIKKMVDEHEKQVDSAIDKAADAAGKKFGHEDQIDKISEKAQGFTGGRHESTDAAER